MSSPATELRRSSRPRSKPAYADPDSDPEIERGGKRRRNAAGGTTRKSGAGKDKPKSSKVAKRPVEEAGGAIDDDDLCPEEPDAEEMEVQEEEEVERVAAEAERAAAEAKRVAAKMPPAGGARKRRVAARPRKAQASSSSSEEERFVGDTTPDHEARQRWPERYTATKQDCGDPEKMGARCHYTSALVDHAIIHLGDDVYVKAPKGEDDYIGRITEFFQGIDRGSYFSCRWFYRVEDTVISPKLLLLTDNGHDTKRVFLSEMKDVNMIESIISKVNITYVDPNVTAEEKAQLISNSDLYYDMMYSVPYSTFAKIPPENGGATGSEATSDISFDDVDSCKEKPMADIAAPADAQMKTATLLDLYSGCGAMSTGLCLGAASAGLKLNTKWAVDMNKYACESVKENHPSTHVRTEKAENFLSLLRHWETLCKEYDVHNSNSLPRTSSDDGYDKNESLPEGTFEVEKLVDICYGDPNNTGNDGLWFKVRWKKYDPGYDTWEPLDGLSDSPECIKEFVESGYRESILPLPGCVDVICGGPPCQGISGLNRFRKPEAPLKDEKNKQLVVFMDIVKYLRPKYLLMENVVDILKFADGFLGRYALSRLVSMGYQARVGMMVAGYYGLPQFRMRAFIWGALTSMVLPKFPLPTHDALNRGVVPTAFSQCLVQYKKTEAKCMEKALVLRDVISDLPKVGNDQPNDVMKYGIRPKTQFQRYIRQNRKDMEKFSVGDSRYPKDGQLFDHQPLKLNINDYERVRQIPVKKGANFRNLEGVRVGENNTVEFDPAIPRVFLPSGKPLVPNYAMTFIKGRSLKPFGRLWWDETVGTVVTRAEPHNQIILHPNQDRVLTVRENARLQGFPDYYRLYGPIKQKYIQVGNAVAVPVARALGYSLGQAYQQGESHGDQHPLFKLPENFIPVSEPRVARRLFPGTGGGEEVVEE